MKPAEDRQTAEKGQLEGRTWWQHLRHVRKRRFALLALLVVMTTGFILGGFVRYTEATAALARGGDRLLKADAIVVLTGGANRIQQAVSLLQSGHGQRLLISGVNPGTSRTTLARMTDTDRRLFDCCVDIDVAALDTVGNAQEATRWAKDHGFDELILVTSDYHMERSIVEFERVGGLKSITPVAVRRDDFWQDDSLPTTSGLKVLLTEYVKLMAARLRASLDGADAPIAVAAAAVRQD
ncbi:MAG: YdcF family protein [Fulvimarina manganoxydans]|uniref:YdcF family protein n=1 Tax=Fulvimarina manganoxydans TaxID=937218 RepID=UPI00235362A1|nr:YdcF family protein [Fulvimarina manganoxydans]MCK5934916.1 YdcF family protein [Fulvimarina manganoxydans]